MSPALYSTVGKYHEDGTTEVGLVVSQPVVGLGRPTVSVEWEHGTIVEDVDALLTEVGVCDHGSDASARCGMDAAPGYTRCERHDGASPLEVRRG